MRRSICTSIPKTSQAIKHPHWKNILQEMEKSSYIGGVLLGEILHSGIDLPCFNRKCHPSGLPRLGVMLTLRIPFLQAQSFYPGSLIIPLGIGISLLIVGWTPARPRYTGRQGQGRQALQ
jgi:hypothetical protein